MRKINICFIFTITDRLRARKFRDQISVYYVAVFVFKMRMKCIRFSFILNRLSSLKKSKQSVTFIYSTNFIQTITFIYSQQLLFFSFSQQLLFIFTNTLFLLYLQNHSEYNLFHLYYAIISGTEI